jgi:hypothetical protein
LQRDPLAEAAENMHMVLNTTRLQRRAAEVLADPCQIGVDALTKLLALQERVAVFRRENNVQVDLSQGLRHVRLRLRRSFEERESPRRSPVHEFNRFAVELHPFRVRTKSRTR